jgi:hypothetical protein
VSVSAELWSGKDRRWFLTKTINILIAPKIHKIGHKILTRPPNPKKIPRPEPQKNSEFCEPSFANFPRTPIDEFASQTVAEVKDAQANARQKEPEREEIDNVPKGQAGTVAGWRVS